MSLVGVGSSSHEVEQDDVQPLDMPSDASSVSALHHKDHEVLYRAQVFALDLPPCGGQLFAARARQLLDEHGSTLQWTPGSRRQETPSRCTGVDEQAAKLIGIQAGHFICQLLQQVTLWSHSL